MRRRPPAMPRRRVTPPSLFHYFLLLLLPVAAAAYSDSYSVDRSALLQLKASVTSDPAGLLAVWTDAAGSDHCSWPGVACDASSRVVALNLSSDGAGFPSASCPRSGPFWRRCPDPARRLAGKLSPAVGALSELKVLSFPFHAFEGEIPGEIWGLAKLEVVDVEANSLSGFLPSKLRSSLRVLILASNLIRGEIPHSLSSCVGLETLDLSGNLLNGTIPQFLGGFLSLRELSLSFNQLGGSIPDELGSGCQSLQHLDLSGNLLVGSIPRGLGNCRELQSLLLSSNLLDDVIPLELGRLRKLRVLDVSRNCLSGHVPAELGGCIELSVLVLSNPYNPITLSDNSSYADTDEFNYFQGGIAENITALPNLKMLWAPKAMLEGEIPSSWGTCKSLEMVNLGENLFTGGIPKVFSQCHNLKFLNLSSNRLTGWLGQELPVPCMDVLDLSGNYLTGSIPSFNLKACPSSQLLLDDLASGYSSFFSYRTLAATSLAMYDFGSNITVYHNLGWNKFTGGLPPLALSSDRLGKQTIYAFLANNNNLVGPLNDVIFEKCNELKGLILNVSNNWISGEFPIEVGAACQPLMVFDVSDNRVAGVIPLGIGLLENIVGLDFSRNHLQGEIPPNFEYLEHLQYLSLGKNNLSGSIPAGFSQLHALKFLDLSSNSLSGEIPSGIVNLKNLSALLLDNNHLSGKIPLHLADMASLSMFNVSFNNLSGPLPMNASMLTCDSVLGNPLFQSCPVNTLSIPPSDRQGRSAQDYTDSSPVSPPSNNSNAGFSNIEIASMASASAIVCVLLALIVLYIYTRKCAPRFAARSSRRREVTLFTDIGVPITFESVVRAAGNFNASNCIGHGGFGATYKAEISPGVLVAIKRLSIGRFQGVQQFHAEIKTLGRWRHPNLVTLIGYYLSEEEMFLIYNYLSGGNLERFIQERHKRVVDWRILHKIALDVACALAYLHDHCVPRILHRDVKPSNILLDNDYKAYLSDFGLARLLGNSETHATTGVAGTFGYVAPEYAMTCRVSDKADVYSYGVVLMELISDKKALDPSFSPYGNGFNIVAWACMLLRQGRAREFFMEDLWENGPHDDLVEILHLAVMCTVDSLSIRPTMKQVVQRLKQLQPPTC